MCTCRVGWWIYHSLSYRFTQVNQFCIGEKMILQIDEAAYNNIIYALEYAILDLDEHNHNIYLDDKKKDLEKP